MKEKTDKPKIATAGKLEIAINHFTTDITPLPYWMDSNCYIVFSLLWRRYISSSINEKLITPDGWFQYTMKSLMIHSGFKDKSTLHRTVEGLYRSGLIDVRVEDGSRLWACWKMNKKNIEYVASIPDRDAMQEPFLNSINTIGSKDKNYTYQLNKEGITELMKFFMVNPVENPPLFNTITPYHHSTTSQDNHNTSLPYNHTTLPPQDYKEEAPSEKNKEEEMEREFEKPMEEEPFAKDNNGVSEAMTRDEEETKEKPNESQLDNKKTFGENQDHIFGEVQDGEAKGEGSSRSQSNDEDAKQQQKSNNSLTTGNTLEEAVCGIKMIGLFDDQDPSKDNQSIPKLSVKAATRIWAEEQEAKYQSRERTLQNLAMDHPLGFEKYVNYLKLNKRPAFQKHKELIHDLAVTWEIDVDLDQD